MSILADQLAQLRPLGPMPSGERRSRVAPENARRGLLFLVCGAPRLPFIGTRGPLARASVRVSILPLIRPAMAGPTTGVFAVALLPLALPPPALTARGLLRG